MDQQPVRIVVLGAGYAGLLFTTRLAGKTRGRDVHITLVSEFDTFTERVRLHQYATNQAVQWRSIPQLLRRSPARFVQGRVTSIESERREVAILREGRTQRLEYDYLVYALGSLVDRHKVPGVDQYAYTLAPSGPFSAVALRATLPALRAHAGRVVVCGGGATGIETAAEIAAAYPEIGVQLVTQGAFGMFLGTGVARHMRRSLEALGIAIRDHTTVTAVREDGVVVDGGLVIPCDLCLWAGGFVAPPLAHEAGLSVNERDQILVDPYMRALGHPEIYAIGDAAHPRDDPGVPVRMSAFTAAILGAHGADCLSAALHGKMPQPLRFVYVGQGIALGRHNAIGFNNYPDDRPNRPYFTGRIGYELRESFVRFLAAAPRLELRWPGFFFWLGGRRSITGANRESSDLPERARERARR